MDRDLLTLSGQYFDLLVIGGGIFGAAVARDAALRGLRVALIDKSDFASGTSSRSSKLIHGGFRYLQQHNFRLVFEACHERHILQQTAPHIVRPLPFLFPIYRGGKISLSKLRLGMTLYDWLAFRRNVAPHRTLSAERALMSEPSLSREGLRGAVAFHDCQDDDARLCVDQILHATELGASCINYCKLTGFVCREDRIVAARVWDEVGSCTFEISARAFINAAGPWVDQVNALTPFDTGAARVSPAKGVHLIVPRLTRQHAVAFEARSDHRILFVIPWGDYSLVGTTDTNFNGDPDYARAEQADIDYLLTEARARFPGAALSESDIVATTVGIRSVVASAVSSPSARSREHRIVRTGRNLLSIIGGKYTTHRIIAQQTVDAAYGLLGMTAPPCRTAETLLPNRRPASSGEKISKSPEVYVSDILHACQHEMAVALEDVMRRRTPLALSRSGGPEIAVQVAKLMAPVMGWNTDEERAQFERYVEEWKHNLP
ncbi:MAG TPA: glycerol-3-phosphate dehydrogenase/oxidase [Verrucomicrobiae bacterium]|nr:glycerol-3-phosphate dehydrogenase/oxidase [Verrucomicrobiae bacterium]